MCQVGRELQSGVATMGPLSSGPTTPLRPEVREDSSGPGRHFTGVRDESQVEEGWWVDRKRGVRRGEHAAVLPCLTAHQNHPESMLKSQLLSHILNLWNQNL